MPAGDLIVGPTYPQYEYNQFLFGSGTDIIVEKVKGLLDTPELKSTDEQRAVGAGWGDFPGLRDYKARFITFNVIVLGLSVAAMEDYVEQIPAVFITRSIPLQFVWQRTGKSKLFTVGQAREDGFRLRLRPGQAEVVRIDHAQVRRSPEVFAPRVHRSVDHSECGTTINGNVVNNGSTEAFPVLEILGPCINPRVQNTQDQTTFSG
jgi:hypothetical protein